MASVSYLIRDLSKSVESIFLSPEQNFPPTDGDDQSDADVDEFPSDDEEVHLIHHSGVEGDIEEGRWNSGGREVFILYFMGTIYNSSIVCRKPEFYKYSVIANLISILAFMVHCMLKCCHRKKQE
ncbi:hypothetical protein AVEN_51104-1 [Araneus ventricosus]|uniref:Uncharacterized protein n=1 Tax=Araneus ventricosus TaxID=182803 RepID=A0A4Y2TI70_ARAVE|nr:hypothetical protein AVEN_51104-1 [Araneus ventricosus]